MNPVKWWPETQAIRNAVAHDYRELRKISAPITRLLWRAEKRAELELARQLFE